MFDGHDNPSWPKVCSRRAAVWRTVYVVGGKVCRRNVGLRFIVCGEWFVVLVRCHLLDRTLGCVGNLLPGQRRLEFKTRRLTGANL